MKHWILIFALTLTFSQAKADSQLTRSQAGVVGAIGGAYIGGLVGLAAGTGIGYAAGDLEGAGIGALV